MFFGNVGTADRWIRVISGAVFLILALVRGDVFGTAGTWMAGVVGAVFVLTGLSGDCPLYKLFGINTRKK